MSAIEKLLQQNKESRIRPILHLVKQSPISIPSAKERVSKVSIYNRLVKFGIIITRIIAQRNYTNSKEFFDRIRNSNFQEVRLPLFPKRAFGGSAISYNNTPLHFKKIPFYRTNAEQKERFIRMVKREDPECRTRMSRRSSYDGKENQPPAFMNSLYNSCDISNMIKKRTRSSFNSDSIRHSTLPTTPSFSHDTFWDPKSTTPILV